MIYQKLFMISAAFTMTAAGMVLVLIYPAFGAIKDTSAIIAAEKKRIVFIEEQSKAFGDFQKKYASYEDNFTALERLFIDKDNPILVIEFMESASARAGVRTWISLVASQDKTGGALPVIFFDIAVAGDFSSIGAFSRSLEEGPYLIAIKKATIEKPPDNQESLDFSQGKQEKVPNHDLKAKFLVEVIAK